MNFKYVKNFMDRLTEDVIPGNTIRIYKDNELVFRYSSGYSDLENKIPMTGDELFNLWSCSKPITVVAALQLFEQGYFLMGDPLYDYIPEFKEMYIKGEDGSIKKATKPITIGSLFNMSAGLTYDTQRESLEEVRKSTNGKMNTLDVIKALSKDPISFEPGTKWQYSLCHDVLAGLVEAISGKKFRDYVKENIFTPLGMDDSHYHLTPELEKRMAQQYELKNENSGDLVNAQMSKTSKNGVVINAGKKNSLVFGEEYDSGGAGIITTMSDYVKFANCMAHLGKTPDGERILSSRTVELLRLNHIPKADLGTWGDGQLSGYGYGLGVRTMVDKARGGSLGPIGEFGWGGAAGASIYIDPENKLAAVYSHHMLNPLEGYYQPRLRNVIYASLD